MGEVYLARDKNLKRQVAIKILSGELTENSDQLRRFKKEAAYAASLNHPNICTIYETGEINGLTYICMEYVEGETLRNFISKPLSVREVLDISIQIADALDEAHKKNVVHRDIKGSNILITSRKLVKILDFGLAKQLPKFEGVNFSDNSTDSLITAPGAGIKGTISYMSPEAILGKRVDHRSDIFSFGVLVYEMLTGRLPFAGDSAVEVLDAILHNEPAPITRYNDKVPDGLLPIPRKMLEKDPENRYQSVHEVWIDLRRIRDDSIRIDSLGSLQPPPLRRRSSRNFAIPAVLFVLLAIAGGYWFLNQRNKTPQSITKAVEKKTLAVVPFQFNGDEQQRYLSTLVTDALIAGLESESELSIAPYATVKDLEKESTREVSRELGVQWVIRGGVSVHNSDLLIKPELLNSDGETIWNNEMQGSSKTLVSTLETLKNGLLAKLSLSGKSKSKAIDRLRTSDIDAYKHYVEARTVQEKWEQEENLDEAVASYRKAIEIDPNFAAAHAGLAQVLVSQYLKLRTAALLAEAASEAKKAIAQNPDLPEALFANGLVQFESKNPMQAKAAFEKALETAPGNDAACRNIASIHELMGRHVEASQMYKKSIEVRPNFWRNHYVLGRFLYFSMGDSKEARVHLLKATELNPDASAPLVVLGLLDLARGELASAEIFFRKVLEKGPDSYAQTNLGVVYYYRGKYDLALRNWQALLQQAPDDATNQANVADAYRAIGDQDKAREHYELAIQEFRAAIASNPQDLVSRAGIAMALSAIGNCEEAKKEAKNVLTLEIHGGYVENQSPSLLAYSAVTATRCKDNAWATSIVIDGINDGNFVDIMYHPDLEMIRQKPEVKRALANLSQ